ncbi:PAS domain S-box-containing protein/diguanylate cyclase (GGDEF) domain-containing protein [Duganella sp. CF402]|uniref:putative bifunctional diguanylate cyclase/phosphodiesterase n=1 Tax=unclassified Duganella TaxID=2636909 RepID=UPI0008C55417|nr:MULTISPECIES: EAL domain-containing protein [unclassified Duganella]RZT06225.1 PAS domain S-box-containing protein/diguanylate cyclase (GGDEF)-like protein [Duganella sp. BK701]SEM71482.1 PAS domain S-box-containing protein/diguanylate cyclase (GGDEF) domain-containing protein [Duganella sp. CF402]
MAVANDIAHWRAQIFARLLLVVFLLGLFTAVPSVLLAISEGMWSIAVVDSVALVWIGVIWRWRGLAYTARVINFLAVAFVVGLALLLKVGPVSQIYLMAVPVLAALLLGLRPAMITLALAGLAVMVLGFEDNANLHLQGLPDYGFLKAAIISINFMFMTAVLTLSCAVLLQHLERSFETMSLLNAELRLTSAAVARLNDMVLIAEVDKNAASPDTAQHIIFVNEAFERRTGYRRDEVIGQNLRMLRGPATEQSVVDEIERHMARSQPVRAELLNYTKTGEPYWVETELVPFADEGGVNTHWVAVERDITERKKSQDDIHRLAFFDVLTGLPNRRLLMDRIDKLLASSERGATYSAVMFIDLDRFKTINDARGHAIGDALLCNAADRLSKLMRKADTVARIGGDEFVVLLGHLSHELPGATHAALTVAEKIRAAIGRDFEIEGQSYNSTASIGVTMLPKTGQTAQDLLREADTAMYRAKSEGRNGIAFFESAMQAEVEQRLTLERDLAAALAAGELQMHVQAQVDRNGRAIGGELLMRWPQADGGMIPPNVFIPVAEECGLIVELGNWALRQACAAVLQLQAAGLAMPLSVNVSPTQFRQADFVEQVQQALAESGAPARLLVLEVTEGLLIDKMDDTIARMHQLTALGLRFSIDDFGTGYSSMAYLKKMPLYELKIDRSFIMDTPEDASSKALVQSILAMAGHLGLRVVAEGVETQAQADFLIANDCDSMQGYLYARPMPLAALIDRLRSSTAVAAA